MKTPTFPLLKAPSAAGLSPRLTVPVLAGAAGLVVMLLAAHPPRLGLIAAEPPAVVIHLVAAFAALGIGLVLLAGVKGTRLHRALGWSWVLAMGTVAASSFFIHAINPGGFSYIHLLSGWTLVGLPAAVYAARRRKVAIHARAMTLMFVGGLIVAGAFTFVPGRLMWRVFVG